MTIGEIIRDKRQKKGWSMQNLADSANITTAYISDIENNKRKTPPTNDTLVRIAQALEMSSEHMDEMLKLAAMERTPDIIIKELGFLKKENELLKKENELLKKEKISNMGSFNNIKIGKNTRISNHINIRNGLTQSYNESDIVEKINELPKDLQKEVFEFINFKYIMYKRD